MTVPTLLLAALAASAPLQDLPLDAPPAGADQLPALGLSPEAMAQASQTLTLDEPGDGRTWARGPQWKASFGSEGFVYVPFLGSHAPRNEPVRFDLSRVTLGGEALALSARSRERKGATVTLDRGSVAEVYHLTKDTVEQTFVFEALPATGDLVLKLEVDTELSPAPDAAGGFRFESENGYVHYGAATAVDGGGRSLPLEQTLANGILTLLVPEAFVSTAELPLIVDPIVSTFQFSGGPRDILDVDVAYDGNNEIYQVVYSERQSGLDFDVIAITYSAQLGAITSVSAIDVSTTSWTTPANASAYHEEQFLCVALRGLGIGSREVWGRTRDADTGNGGPQFRISGVGADSVDVGGKGNDISSIYDYMVVWQEADTINADFDIVAQAVNGNSTLTDGRIVLAGGSDDLDRKPSISKSSGRPSTTNPNSEYMIVWEREVATDNRNLRAQVMEYTGVLTGHSQFNAYTFSDSINPDVSMNGGLSNSLVSEDHWLIAFERRVGTDYDIFLVVARDGDADNARSLQTMQNLDLDRDHRGPALAFDGHDHFVLYQSETPSGDRSLHLTAANVVRDGPELRTGVPLRRETLALSEGAPASFAIATHFGGGAPTSSPEPGEAVAIWTTRDAASDDYDPAGAVLNESGPPTLGSQFCAAADNSSGSSGFIQAIGSGWDLSDTLFLEASDLPQNSFGHFIVSNQSGFVMNPGGSQGNLCLGGSVGRFNRPGEIRNSGSTGAFLLTVDTGSLPSPNGTVAAGPGETWYFQCWFRDVGPSSNFTSAVEVTFQ